jgi:long-chain acyl-CoA synthetase
MGEYVSTRFQNICEQYPGHPALIYLGERWSFVRLRDAIERFATALADLRIGAGDRALLSLPNCVQWVVAYFGLQRIGAVPVPVSPFYTSREIGFMAEDTQAELIICQDTNFGYIQRLRSRSGINKVIVVNLADVLPAWKRAVGFLFDRVPRGRVARAEGVHRFRRMLRKYPPQPPPLDTDPGEQLAYILYTGGTTGFPKGVPGTHRSMVSYVNDLTDLIREYITPAEDVFILVNPLFHIMAKGMFMTLGLNAGCTTIVMPEPQVDAILEAIQRHRATLLLGVPALYRMILDHDRLDLYDLSSLRLCFSGGDTLPAQVFERWHERVGVKIRQVYGSTEVGFVSMGRLDREPAPLSLGTLLPSRRYRVVDPDTLEDVQEGEVGELLVTSDHILKAYWNNPQETARSYVELEGETWYRMGDYVRRDGDEAFYVDRSPDLIQYKGYRVSASEVEAVLQDHPAVIEACVVGVPDPEAGERVKAFVVLKEGTRGVSSSELIGWCRQRVAHYKTPRYIEFRDMLPKSKVGKLLRREIRDEERRRAGSSSGPSGP